MNPLIQSKNITILAVFIALTLACFALSQQARAVCQEGCLTNANTVLGDDALVNNTTGVFNTATGFDALRFNTNGGDNTATGVFALLNNINGGANTASGVSALYSNTAGEFNTANGVAALYSNTTGSNNIAVGSDAMLNNNTGSSNIAVGFEAMVNNKQGSGNIALGYRAGLKLSGNDNIAIANPGVRGEFGTIRIGTIGTQTNAYIAGVSGATVPTGVAVIVDADGHLGTITSSARFKEAIKSMDKASETILALKPVTFRYKKELDPEGVPQFGLVAEDVEKVNSELVVRDDRGKPFTVRYDAVNAMLLNEFLKEHRKVEKLEATVAKQHRDFEAALADLKGQIQKVSAQLEASKPAPQVVNNP
jgi:hypothetical protein